MSRLIVDLWRNRSNYPNLGGEDGFPFAAAAYARGRVARIGMLAFSRFGANVLHLSQDWVVLLNKSSILTLEITNLSSNLSTDEIFFTMTGPKSDLWDHSSVDNFFTQICYLRDPDLFISDVKTDDLFRYVVQNIFSKSLKRRPPDASHPTTGQNNYACQPNVTVWRQRIRGLFCVVKLSRVTLFQARTADIIRQNVFTQNILLLVRGMTHLPGANQFEISY